MNAPSKFPSILNGAIVSALLGIVMSIPTMLFMRDLSPFALSGLGLLNCLILPLAGAFTAVWHYNRVQNGQSAAGEGAALGAGALALGSLFSSALSFIFQMTGLFPSNEEIKQISEDMQRNLLGKQGMDAEQIEQAIQSSQQFNFLSNPVVQIVVGVVMMGVVGAIMGAIAAALVFRSKERES
ncbi:MAG TPA: hypothetical protein DIW24_10165 [Bacteroidetes bacterium]|nr:hypothetical protein [Bacteroidota bacterium]